MRSFQEKLLGMLEDAAIKAGCEAVHAPVYANSGKILVQTKNPAFGAGPFQTIAYVDYVINNGQSTLCFNGNPISPADTSALFAINEDTKINAAVKKWQKLIAAGKQAGHPVETPESAKPSGEAPGIVAARAQRAAGINR